MQIKWKIEFSGFGLRFEVTKVIKIHLVGDMKVHINGDVLKNI